jgi:hypothetical protein
MFAVSPASSANTVVSIQREMALEGALIAQRTPLLIVSDFPRFDDSPAVIIILSDRARAFLADQEEDLLIAELLDTLIAVDAVAIG